MLSSLFSPLRLGSVELQNRIVSTAHQTTLVADHLPTDDFVAYHEARARGGVGLIVMEATAPHPSGILTAHELAGYLPEMVDAYRRVAAAVQPHGTKLFVQLLHGGREQIAGARPRALSDPESAFPRRTPRVARPRDRGDRAGQARRSAARSTRGPVASGRFPPPPRQATAAAWWSSAPVRPGSRPLRLPSCQDARSCFSSAPPTSGPVRAGSSGARRPSSRRRVSRQARRRARLDRPAARCRGDRRDRHGAVTRCRRRRDGARPYSPSLPLNPATVVQAWAVLAGTTAAGKRVAVADWGGDSIGINTAELLAEAGHDVVYCVASVTVGESLHQYRRNLFLQRLYRAGVQIVQHHELVGGDAENAILRNVFAPELETTIAVDTIVLALGRVPDDDLAPALRVAGLRVEEAGDCLSPRGLEEAVLEGTRAAQLAFA